jgi:cytochrome c-type biogenesis protein
MGLNLLELIPLSFPNLDTSGWINDRLAPPVRGYLIGLTFGLIASPCSTPVLATLLAWIVQAHNFALGAGLLLAYTAGSIMPIAIAGTFTVALTKLLALRQWSRIINIVSGFALVGFGLFSLVSRVNFI